MNSLAKKTVAKHSDAVAPDSTKDTDMAVEQPKAYFVACFQLCVLEAVRKKLRCCPDEADGVTKKSIVRFLEKQ